MSSLHSILSGSILSGSRRDDTATVDPTNIRGLATDWMKCDDSHRSSFRGSAIWNVEYAVQITLTHLGVPKSKEHENYA